MAAPGTWDRERVVCAIRDWYRETGVPPKSYEWSPRTGRILGLIGDETTRWEREHPRWPERQTVRAHFGSWRAAMIEVGLPTPPPLHGTPAERIRVARCLADVGEPLVSIADHLGVHVNSARNYLKATRCPGCNGYKVSATAVLCLTCFLHEHNRPSFDEAAMIDAIRTWSDETGDPPSKSDWTPWRTSGSKWHHEWPRWPSADQVAYLFGTWTAAVRRSGVPNPRARRQ